MKLQIEASGEDIWKILRTVKNLIYDMERLVIEQGDNALGVGISEEGVNAQALVLEDE